MYKPNSDRFILSCNKIIMTKWTYRIIYCFIWRFCLLWTYHWFYFNVHSLETQLLIRFCDFLRLTFLLISLEMNPLCSQTTTNILKCFLGMTVLIRIRTLCNCVQGNNNVSVIYYPPALENSPYRHSPEPSQATGLTSRMCYWLHTWHQLFHFTDAS